MCSFGSGWGRWLVACLLNPFAALLSLLVASNHAVVSCAAIAVECFFFVSVGKCDVSNRSLAVVLISSFTPVMVFFVFLQLFGNEWSDASSFFACYYHICDFCHQLLCIA